MALGAVKGLEKQRQRPTDKIGVLAVDLFDTKEQTSDLARLRE